MLRAVWRGFGLRAMTAVDRPVLESELHHHHMLKMQQPETAKSVHVYLNGDKHYPGRKFVINRRHISDFNGFLNEVKLSNFLFMRSLQ